MYAISPIPTFAINLIHRTDRQESIRKEFGNRKEFEFQVFPAIHFPENGALGLWLTFKKIVEIAHEEKYPFVLVCEDDHILTENYSTEKLQEQIRIARDTGADVLLGGVSWFDFSVKICDGIHRVNKFNGTQFLIVFDGFYNAILSQDDSLEHGTLDMAISSLSNNKLVSFPFISVQKDIGYSDATKNNNASGFVETLFRGSTYRFQTLENVHRHIATTDLAINGSNYDEYQLPT